MNPTSTVVLWQGSSSDLAAVASGGRVAYSSYAVTEDAIKFASGMLSTREESIPLWAVRDCDLRQSLLQRSRGVGDLTLRIDPNHAATFGQLQLVLKSIKNAARVRDLIVRQAKAIRIYWAQHTHDRDSEHEPAGAINIHTSPHATTPPIIAVPADDFTVKLTTLAEMKTAGLLTEEEFASAKAKLLG